MKKEDIKEIFRRKITKKFKREQITKEELEIIIESAFSAPGARNRQPWHFTIVQDKKLIDEMSCAAKKGAENSEDELLAKTAGNKNYDIFCNAPTIIIVSGKNSLSSIVNCAAATENMVIAAEALGIGSYWNGFIKFLFKGILKNRYDRKLKIPEGYIPFYSVAFGYKESERVEVRVDKESAVTYIL